MVDVLLAVYNGGEYLKKQLDSLISQTYGDFCVIICDDGSTDGSRDILTDYAAKFPHKIKLFFNKKNIGVKNNFFRLLKLSSAEYIMFCDQDDVWDSDKIAKTLDFFRQNEYGGPLLVHTDMRITDENDSIISDSFNKMQGIDPYKNSLNILLVQNTVTGCTVMINRALADITKHPACKTLHDWWMAVTAAVFGRIAYLPEATMCYRRHSKNVRGARDMSSVKYILSRFAEKTEARAMLRLGYAQSAEFARLYKDELNAAAYKMLYFYGKCLEYGKIKRLFTILRFKIFKQGTVRRIGQLIYL